MPLRQLLAARPVAHRRLSRRLSDGGQRDRPDFSTHAPVLALASGAVAFALLEEDSPPSADQGCPLQHVETRELVRLLAGKGTPCHLVSSALTHRAEHESHKVRRELANRLRRHLDEHKGYRLMMA